MLTFRDILKKREEQGSTNFHSILEEIYNNSNHTWLPLLGEKWGSYNGLPHIQSVEDHLNKIVTDEQKNQFSSLEIFILLCSVLLHDIGKINVKSDKENIFHHIYSCSHISKNWSYLKIPDDKLAKWISIIACSHGWDKPSPCGNCPAKQDPSWPIPCKLSCDPKDEVSELDTEPEINGVTIQLKKIAALLRVCDEVDNQICRTIPLWILESMSKERRLEEDPSWRRHIKYIKFDRVGKCIKLQTKTLEVEWLRKPDNQYHRASKALNTINKVLKGWELPLKKMGLEFEQAYIETMLPAAVLLDSKQLLDFKLSKNKQCVIEPGLNKLSSLLHDMLVHLDYGIIGDKKFFTWNVLAEELGIINIDEIKASVHRIESIKTAKDKKLKYKHNDLIINKNFPSIIVKEHGIEVTHPFMSGNDGEQQEFKESLIIPTGIKVLDNFLCPDWKKIRTSRYGKGSEINLDKFYIPDEDCKGGFYAPVYIQKDDGREAQKRISPLVAIEGGSGSGKTTMCLQIACNLLLNKPTNMTVVYYALEQSAEEICNQLEGYNFFSTNFTEKDRIKNNVNDLNSTLSHSFTNIQDSLLLPYLTPRILNGTRISPEEIFIQRFQQLHEALTWMRKNKMPVFFIIDSLTAFSTRPLTRDETTKLFYLFKKYKVPLIVTLERQKSWAIDNEKNFFNHARYLANTVIRIDEEYFKNEYYRRTIEVRKTRYNRRILGKHLLKLKSPEKEGTGSFDERFGIVIYPSIDNHIVNSRTISEEHSEIVLDISEDQIPIDPSSKGKTQTVDANSCIVISGAQGTHKFAIATNLLLRTKKPRNKNFKQRLIISFAEEREIKLQRVALLEDFKKGWENILNNCPPRQESDGMKILEQEFNYEKKTYITLLNFRPGKIMPEEFLYIFNNYLDNRKEEFESVLFTDTAQIRTRFPYLASESLFFPTIIEILKSKDLLSIFIDVKEKDALSEALLAAADYRIFLKRQSGEGTAIDLNVDSVRGKDYDRHIRKMEIEYDKEASDYYLVLKKENKDKD